MSLSKWFRKMAAGSPRQTTIRRVRRPDGSIKSNYDLYLEYLEDRMAPANVLLWTGADANINLTVPGLMGQYYRLNESTLNFIPANATNPNWLGLGTPVTPTGFTSPNIPITGTINFPSIGTNGAKSFTSADNLTTVVTRTTNVEARWFGYVNIPNNGKAGNPVSFRIRSDDCSVLYIDNTLVVNNDVNQGATTRGATINLTPGMHLVDVEYGQAGGGASMTAQWDPQGGTSFNDFPDGINFFYNSSTSGNINWSDGNNWVIQGSATHATPGFGDTLVFSSNTSTNPGFTSNAFTSNNDLTGLTLNGIITDASGGGAFTLNGNGVTITNTDQSMTAGISNGISGNTLGDSTFIPTSLINLQTIKLGANATITNSSAPMVTSPNLIPGTSLTATAISNPSLTNVPILAATIFPAFQDVRALLPSLTIGSRIDLAGFGLTEGPNGSTPDTGFTHLDGNISSTVPTTDSLTMSGSGILGLSGLSVAPIATISTSSPTTAISSITESTGGTTALVTTTSGHNLVVGQTVVISGASVGGYNGTFTVTATPSATTFNYTAGSAGLASNTAAGAIVTANIATVTTTVPHGLAYGQTVVIQGTGAAASASTITAYNGNAAAPGANFTVLTTPSANTFTYSGTTIVAGLVSVTGGAAVGQGSTPLGIGGNTFDGVVTVNSGQLMDAGREALGFPGRNSQQTLQINTSAAMTGAAVTTSAPAITSASVTGTTATVITAAPHNFVVGESVAVAGSSNAAYNGTFTVTGVTDPSTFTYTLSGAPGASTGGTATGTLATVTTGSAHNLTVGMPAIMAGSSIAGYNTTAKVLSVPSATTFTFNATAGTAAGTGGTVNPGSQVVGSTNSATVNAITETGTTATFTASAAHGFSVGQQVQISGANIAVAIASVKESGNLVTVTTATAHGFQIGDNATVENATVGGYNGTFRITSVPSTTTFTYQIGALGLSDSGAVGTVRIPLSASIASMTESGTTVTVTTTFPNSFQTGQSVIIGGASVSAYNGVYTIASVVDSTHFTFTSATSGLAPSDKGTALLSVAYDKGYNGTVTILAVPTTTTFTYTAPAGLTPSTGGSAYPISNTFTVSFGGQTTIPIPFNSSAGSLSGALSGLTSIGAGNVSVGGGPASSIPYSITFQGVLGYAPQANITADATNLAGGPKTATPNVTFGTLPIAGLAPGGNITVKGGATLSVSRGDTVNGQQLGDGTIYGKWAVVNAGATLLAADNTGPTVTIPLQFANPFGVPNPTVTNFGRTTTGPTWAGPVLMGQNGAAPGTSAVGLVSDTVFNTAFFGVSNSLLNGQYNAVSLFTTPRDSSGAVMSGASISNININRTTLGSASPNLLNATLTATKGVLAAAANAAFGPGGNTVTAASGASIGLRAGANYFTPQILTTTPGNLGSDLGAGGGNGASNGPLGAFVNIDSTNTWSGITLNAGSGDIHIGSIGGGTMILMNPFTLTGSQKLEINANNGPVNMWSTSTITGPATTGLIKNSAGVITAANGGGISSTASNLNINSSNPGFAGTVTINGGLLNAQASGALGVGTTPIVVNQSAIQQGGLGITAPSFSTTALTETGTTVTVTTGANHGFTVGQAVTIAGVTPGGYNGTFAITAVTANTFTYTAASGLATATAQGTAQGGIDVGSNALNINGPGPGGAGAIENISGPNKLSGLITLGGPTTIGSDAGIMTLNGNIVTNPVISGVTTNRLLTFTGAGNTLVNGAILGSAGNAFSAGLLETHINVANSQGPGAAPNSPLGSTIQLTPLMGETNTVSDTTTSFPTTRHLWSSNDTWIYTGTIFFPNDPLTPGFGNLSFAKNVDDSTFLYIDGITLISNNSWSTPIGTSIQLPAGPHTFEVRFGNGGGGAGATGNTVNGDPAWVGWTTSVGFVYRVNSGTADPKATSKNVADYVIPRDNGTGNLFAVSSANVLTKTGAGTVTFNGANTYVASTNIIAGEIVSGTPAALGNTTALTVGSGGGLQMAAAGGQTLGAAVPVAIAGSGSNGNGAIQSLGGANSIASPIRLTSAATLQSDAGTLTLSGPITMSNGVITYAGAGNINVTGVMSTIGAGLTEGQTNVANDITATRSPINLGLGITVQLGTTMGNISNNASTTVANPTASHVWTSNDTFIYTGTIFWPNDPLTPGKGSLSFAGVCDDSFALWIDGITYISRNGWTTPAQSGNITLPAGPHTFEARFGNGGGGAGADSQNNNGYTGFTGSIGFVFRVNSGSTDPLATSTNVTDYFQATPAYTQANGKPAPLGGLAVDPGDGSLFSTAARTGMVKNGAGTLTLGPTNTFLGPINLNGGVTQIVDDFSLGRNTVAAQNNAVAVNPITIGAATLEFMGTTPTASSIGSNFSYILTNAASTIMTDPGQTVTINNVLSGTGALNKAGTGTLVLASANSYAGGTKVTTGTLTAGTKLSLGSGTATLAGGTLSLQGPLNVQQPIGLTAASFNQDVVWAKSEADPTAGTSTTFSGAVVFYETGQLFSFPGSGLPSNGQITSLSTAGVSFQLGAYNTNQVRLLTDTTTTATMVLSTPGQYASLNVLSSSFTNSATVNDTYNMILVFSDGSTTTVNGAQLPDFRTTGVLPAGNATTAPFLAGAATVGFGEIQRTVTFNTPGYAGPPAYPSMYENDFTLSAGDQAKTLSQVRFVQTIASKLGIFALSGVNIGSPPVTYANAVSVTANSTLDTTSATIPSVTVGTLTMAAGTTLNMTGNSTNSVTFGATTLNGADVISPATGETVTLGTVANGGGTTTLSVGPLGTVNVPNIPSGVTLIGGGQLGAVVSVASGGAINPGATSGSAGNISIIAGGLTMAAGATFNADIGGTTAGTQYDQVSSGGTITLGGATLAPALFGGFVPTAGQTFTIIKNTGTSAIGGTFKYLSPNNVPASLIDLPDGAKFNLPGNVVDFQINYNVGATKDVVLTALTPGAANKLAVLPAITTVAAGTPMTFTVIAQDAAGLTAAGYSGTVNFTSSDGQAVLPANGATLTNSVGTFVVTFKTAASDTLTATDNLTNTGTSSGVTVNPIAANHFSVTSNTVSSYSPGAAMTITVVAKDPFNNTATSAGVPYTGTVKITSTDNTATLPPNATLTAATGTGTFPVTINAATGTYQVIASDTLSSGVTGQVTLSNGTTGAPDHFGITSVSTVTAGVPFVMTISSLDVGGSTAPAYSGTVTISGGGITPIPVTLTQGIGTALVTLNSTTGSPFTMTVHGNGTPVLPDVTKSITVNPGAVSFFTVTPAAGTQTTGNAFNTVVTAKDANNNTITGYTGTVKITSSDPAAATLVASYTFVAGDNGAHTFSTTLKTAGTQTITASVTPAGTPLITGTSANITMRGLVVSTFTASPTGFDIALSKAFVPASVTMYGPGATVQDVTLVGDNWGTISGSLVSNATNTGFTFKASAIPLDFINNVLNGGADSIVLPDDTWHVTIVSGTTNGFKDALGAGLDGLGNGTAANYTNTFSTTYQSAATKVLGLPDFSRGPDSTKTIKVPNDTANGIPVTLYNASALTSATFTIAYNPTLLTVTGAGTADSTGGGTKTFTMPSAPTIIDATHATATFSYTNTSGQSGNVVLGDILSNDPDTSKTNYGVKQLITMSSITTNGSAFTGVTAPAFHINTYFGDVSGNGDIGAADVNPMFSVSVGTATGFGAYSLSDPAIVGDVAGDVTVDGGDVAYLKSFILNLPRTKIPKAPGLGGIVSPSAVDPIISLNGGFQSSGGVLSVPVMLDHPRPEGSSGLTQATLALTYDPSVLRVSASDITFGSIPGLGTGWELVTHIDQATGRIAIEMFGATALTSAQAGSLVSIGFHVLPGTSVTSTAVQLVQSVQPNNGFFYTTSLADAQSGWILSPGVNQLTVPTGVIPAPVTPPPATSTDGVSSLNHGEALDHLAHDEHAGAHSLLLGTEADDVLAVMSNGTVAGESVHSVVANLLVTGALAFQSNQPVAATQSLGQVFQVGSLSLFNNVLAGNTAEQFVDRLFLALSRGTDVASDFDTVASLPTNFWDSVVQDWLVIPTQATPVEAQTNHDATGTVDSQAGQEHMGSDRAAAVERVFAQLMDETDDFRGLGDY